MPPMTEAKTSLYQALFNRRMLICVFTGFSSGLPLYLLLNLLPAWLRSEHVDLRSIGLFALFLFTLKRWTASRVSYAFVLTPIVASTLGSALAGEAVTAAMVIGGITVLAGVYVGVLSGSRTPAPRLTPAREEAAVA